MANKQITIDNPVKMIGEPREVTITINTDHIVSKQLVKSYDGYRERYTMSNGKVYEEKVGPLTYR